MESNSRTNFGGSLKVPSVYELANNQDLSSVPPRYIRAPADRKDDDDPAAFEPINSSSISKKEIPVIDLQKLLSDDDDLMIKNSELQKLHLSCQEWGFFQLVNHGVSSSLVEKVKKEIEAFFHLPKEEKEKFGTQPDDFEGFGHTFVVSEEQKLDWSDIFHIIVQPAYLRKPHLLPKLSLSFREALEVYSAEVKRLSMKIFNQMAMALGMELEDMTVLFDEGMQIMRMNHYPPCPQPELVMGLCPHSDAVALTILLQVNEVEGLQIRKDGAWVPVVPLPGAFIVNVGDVLEIVTNGIYKSVEHRATVTSDKERISIATFHASKLEGDLGPAPSLLTPDNPPKFRRISTVDYGKGLFSRKLDGKSYLDVMRI